MSKIVAISDQIVSIGLDSGKLKDVPKSICNFVPRIGDEVEIFESEDKIIVYKKKVKSTYSEMDPALIDGKVVNKLVYALLGIFLGSFGIHKFYAGKIGMGVLYLLFCWTFIPGLIGFIEGIIALTKQEDADGNIIL